MDERQRWLALQRRPCLRFEDADDLVLVGQGLEQRLGKAQAGVAALVSQFEGANVGLVGPHLAVADYPVPSELKSGNFETRDAQV